VKARRARKRERKRGGKRPKNLLLEHSWSNKQMRKDMEILRRI